MSMCTRVAMVGLLLLAPAYGMAAGQSIDAQTLTYIATGWGQEGIYVKASNGVRSIDGCGPYFMLEPSNPMLKEMMAILLSAYHAGTKVNLYVDGCISPTAMRLKAVSLSK